MYSIQLQTPNNNLRPLGNGKVTRLHDILQPQGFIEVDGQGFGSRHEEDVGKNKRGRFCALRSNMVRWDRFLASASEGPRINVRRAVFGVYVENSLRSSSITHMGASNENSCLLTYITIGFALLEPVQFCLST